MVLPNLGSTGVKNDEVTSKKSVNNYAVVIDKEKKINLSTGTTLKKAYEMCEQIIRNSPCTLIELYNGEFVEFTMKTNKKGVDKNKSTDTSLC